MSDMGIGIIGAGFMGQTYIENRQPPITGWDGRQSVAAALAAYESSRTGKGVTLQ